MGGEMGCTIYLVAVLFFVLVWAGYRIAAST